MGEITHHHKYERSGGKHAAALVREKAANAKVTRLRNEMLLARARGELIEKALVQRQASWLLISLRQAVLALPQTYTRELLGISDPQLMSAKLRAMALSLLEELQHLPEKVTDPNWLDTLEEEGNGK
jgi:hypothetical protein